MSGCPPARDIEPLPPHLKDALRRVLLKRGAVTGGELACLLHPAVEELDLSDCVLSYQHLAALTRQQHLRSAPAPDKLKSDVEIFARKLCLNQSYQDPCEEDVAGCSRLLGKVLMRNPRLEFVNLRKVLFVRDLALSCLPPTVTHLDLGGCRGLTDGGVRRLTSNCPRLTSLSLSSTAVTDRSLLTLSVSRARDTVRELRINGCTNITDTGIEVETHYVLHTS